MANDLIDELNTVKELVEDVLAKDVLSRGNDTRLYVECCKELGCETIDDIESINLSIISVHKLRQAIQNKEGNYKPSEEVLANRSRRRVPIKEYMARLG